MNTPILTILSAAAPAGDAPPAWLQFLPLVAMGFIFWFLILRPQMRRQKEQTAKIAAIKKEKLEIKDELAQLHRETVEA